MYQISETKAALKSLGRIHYLTRATSYNVLSIYTGVFERRHQRESLATLTATTKLR